MIASHFAVKYDMDSSFQKLASILNLLLYLKEVWNSMAQRFVVWTFWTFWNGLHKTPQLFKRFCYTMWAAHNALVLFILFEQFRQVGKFSSDLTFTHRWKLIKCIFILASPLGQDQIAACFINDIITLVMIYPVFYVQNISARST
jgi:hypothetical protein